MESASTLPREELFCSLRIPSRGKFGVLWQANERTESCWRETRTVGMRNHHRVLGNVLEAASADNDDDVDEGSPKFFLRPLEISSGTGFHFFQRIRNAAEAMVRSFGSCDRWQ